MLKRHRYPFGITSEAEASARERAGVMLLSRLGMPAKDAKPQGRHKSQVPWLMAQHPVDSL